MSDTDPMASQADYQSFKNTPADRLLAWQRRYRKLAERCMSRIRS